MSICLLDDDEWFRDMFCQYMADYFRSTDIGSESFGEWKRGKRAGKSENENDDEEEYDLYIFGGAGPEYIQEKRVAEVMERSLFLFRKEEEFLQARMVFPNISMIYKFVSATKLVMHINSTLSAHQPDGKIPLQRSRFFVISVTSTVGGMGKTSVSVVLSRLLQQKKNQSVLIVSTSLLCDIRKYFPMDSAQRHKTLNEYIYRLFAEDRPEQSLTSYMVYDRFGVSAFYMEKEINELASLDADEMERFIKSLDDSSVYDVVVFDLDNSNDKVTGLIASRSDIIFVLTPPEKGSGDMTERWIAHIVRNAQEEQGEIIRVINMEGYDAGPVFYDEKTKEERSKEAYAVIPYDPHSFYRSDGLKNISMTGIFAAAVDRMIEEVMPFV